MQCSSLCILSLLLVPLFNEVVEAFDCRDTVSSVNCAAANSQASCSAACRQRKWTNGVCWPANGLGCAGWSATQKACFCYGEFDCRTVRNNVNCSAANGHDLCDAQCRLFKYGQGICYNFGTTTCPGYPLNSKGCLCYDALDCRTLRTQVNCAAANAATSCTNWCKLFKWTQGTCTTFQASWTCPGYSAGQKACLCQ